jgi:hypothetical protein
MSSAVAGSTSRGTFLVCLWDLLSPSVEFLWHTQNIDLWAKSWVSGRAGNCTELDLENTGEGVPPPPPQQTNFYTGKEEWHGTLSLCRVWLFYPFFSSSAKWHASNASALWYKTRNLLFLPQGQTHGECIFIIHWCCWPVTALLIFWWLMAIFKWLFQLYTTYFLRDWSELPHTRASASDFPSLQKNVM